MIRIFTKSIIYGTLCFCMLGSHLTNAQTAPEAFDIQEFLKTGEENASILMGHYLEPFFKGLGYGASNGWYNTAKAHKTLGFDLTVSASMAKVPSGDVVYEFVETEYQNLTLTPGQSGTSAASVFGDENQSLMLQSEFKGIMANIETPPGLDLEGKTKGYIPLPMIQLGIGLIKNTDLKVRWFPTQKFEGAEVSLIGFGLMHDFKQWIPGIKHLPIDMSILIAYNRIKTTIDLQSDVLQGGLRGTDQVAEFGINSWTYQVLISKKLSILTLYGGVGYNSVKTNLDVKGSYVIQEAVGGLPEIALNNPVSEKFSSTGMRATAGFRLKLAVITLHADYTFQEYNTITAGIGVSIR